MIELTKSPYGYHTCDGCGKTALFHLYANKSSVTWMLCDTCLSNLMTRFLELEAEFWVTPTSDKNAPTGIDYWTEYDKSFLRFLYEGGAE